MKRDLPDFKGLELLFIRWAPVRRNWLWSRSSIDSHPLTSSRLLSVPGIYFGLA